MKLLFGMVLGAVAFAALVIIVARHGKPMPFEYGGALYAPSETQSDPYLVSLIERAGQWPPGSGWTA
jgi:hypothetical protein